LIFYETGYSIFVQRQASRRSWRIGQRKPVKVKFLYYEHTVQASCLRLMGKKLLVSLAMEDKFANERLQAIDEDEDLLMAMARELVQERGIGESADAIWKDLRRQQEELLTTRGGTDLQTNAHPDAPREADDEFEGSLPKEPSMWGPMHQLAVFWRRVLRKTSSPQHYQQSLFEPV
jgi:hypothetical protein